MTPFLDPDWFELLREASQQLPAADGASADVALTISKSPDGNVVAHLLIEDGRIASVELDSLVEAPLQLGCPYDLAADIVRGETTVSVAFMRGELKVNGDMGAMHRVLPLTEEQPFVAMLDAITARTEF